MKCSGFVGSKAKCVKETIGECLQYYILLTEIYNLFTAQK